MDKQVIIIPKSMRMLKRKMGIVYLVGIAARLVTSAIVIATIAVKKSAMLVPARITANTVSGVSIHPCPARAMPNHSNRFSSWVAAHLKNLAIGEPLASENETLFAGAVKIVVVMMKGFLPQNSGSNASLCIIPIRCKDDFHQPSCDDFQQSFELRQPFFF